MLQFVSRNQNFHFYSLISENKLGQFAKNNFLKNYHLEIKNMIKITTFYTKIVNITNSKILTNVLGILLISCDWTEAASLTFDELSQRLLIYPDLNSEDGKNFDIRLNFYPTENSSGEILNIASRERLIGKRFTKFKFKGN